MVKKYPQVFGKWRRPIEAKIDETLEANFDEDEANRIVKYMFRSGGKRCRPLLVILSTQAFGTDAEKALDAAAAVEIIHAATLVFDDMVDKDKVRRGIPTAHMAFSNEKALTSGLFLASKGVQLLSNYKNPEVMRMIGSSLVDVSKGELLDILSDRSASVSECIAIADLKTASLFASAAGIGAAIAGVQGKDLVAMQKYGRCSGMAFQIRDDMLDFQDGAVEESLGGPNIVTSHCIHEAPRPNDYSDKLKVAPLSNRKLTRILKETGSLEFASNKAEEYAKNSKNALRGIRKLRDRRTLEEYSDYLWQRRE
ncbi:MAG TPA: polyprenyl synthetase family protein [Candidatus Binatus sp.]|jgi:geranylgeranyl pyrophosphate synthase|nr:polyprenyl synthetase family protein [Candidatus Binatus sp.]